MAISQLSLPHWDMTVLYPGLDSPEFRAGFQAFAGDIATLEELFDRYGIAEHTPVALDEGIVAAFEVVVEQLNAVLTRNRTMWAYVSSFLATDSRDDLAQATSSDLDQQQLRLSQLQTRFTAWIGGLDVDALIERSAVAREHGFVLKQEHAEAAHLMSPAEEELAAALFVTGTSAWSRMYSNFTSQLMVSFELDGERQLLPISAVRNLAYDPDREVRRRAYEAELAAWQTSTVPIATALNSIKGEMNTLSTRRGWESPLDVALFNNHIDRTTLDAMLQAMRESFPDFRRYMRTKSRALGLPVLAWYDLFAPVGDSTIEWTWEAATAFIERQFATYSAQLSALAGRAFQERWIDAEPRLGKTDGAFCMSLRDGESRILANFKPVFGQVATLAHELGHAYHNLNLVGRTALQRSTPMTFAETASIFCETLVQQAAYQDATGPEQLSLLEASLQGACQVVVDISSRFLFEQHVFEHRRQRELSADELSTLMLEAQRETYGDGLDQNLLHPYMWAVKSHYYGPTFYNFPYTFGLLFGLGLFAQYQHDPERFRARYDDLLSSTGIVSSTDLAARFGIELRTPEFWRASLDVIRADIARFEALIG